MACFTMLAQTRIPESGIKVTVCSRLYWLLEEVCYRQCSCYANEVMNAGKQFLDILTEAHMQ